MHVDIEDAADPFRPRVSIVRRAVAKSIFAPSFSFHAAGCDSFRPPVDLWRTSVLGAENTERALRRVDAEEKRTDGIGSSHTRPAKPLLDQ